MKTSMRFFCVVLCSVFVAIAGCGADGVSVANVTGVVTYNGQPVADALVSFVPTQEGRGASGMTVADGSFVLLTQGATQNGAMLGEYEVRVSKLIAVDASGKPLPPAEPKPYRPDAPPEKQPIVKSMLPKKYDGSEGKSPILQSVVKGKNHFVIDLKD
ncbi:MAG: carboxypeptidase-like regulatory domain-containing protein [Thermoguttaceae bacterium]